jgi:hypothetical protein
VIGQDEIIQVARGRFDNLRFTRPNEVGDHVFLGESLGWGVVVKINMGGLYVRGMLVRLAKRGPDLPRQEFPEWDLQVRAERLRQRNIETGRHDGR